MESIDRDLQVLADRKLAWARLPVGTKIEYLLAVRRAAGEYARDWADAACAAKGLAPGSPLRGEEWIAGPWAVLYALNRYVRTLRTIVARGAPELAPGAVRTRPDGRVVARVYPRTAYDRLLLLGTQAEVWMQDGVSEETLASTMGRFYREAEPAGRVALVLGAGNISSIAALDVLYKFVAGGSVCMLKMNPVNEYLQPIFERVFEPFVAGGFLRFARGGADVGRYLCAHELVDEIHVTGSESTHDAIVAELAHPKPITSELGNVSPTIVLPGTWSDADVRFQAESIATQKMHNAGYNCIAAQVLVLPRDWNGTPRLLKALAEVFRRTAPREPYYPGTRGRYDALVWPHRDAAFFEADSTADDAAFTTEAFCNVLAYVELPGDPAAFLRAAVVFANDRLHGTLGANLIVHPATQRAMETEFEAAIADLRYGCIAVNTWTGVGYFIAETTWGAYPGHTLADIGSGIGVVHNAYLFDKPLKSVIYAPFRPFPRPAYFITNRMQAAIGERLCAFEARPSPARALRVAAAALRG
ncbi:MAG TPA: aldehyde dehydrogenase family protein [Candidatus Baltobacteraceae bacterium]|jgi:hypothetical protein